MTSSVKRTRAAIAKPGKSVSWAATVAALFALAGTTGAMGQSTSRTNGQGAGKAQKASAPASRPMGIAPDAFGAPGARGGEGGEDLRDPMENPQGGGTIKVDENLMVDVHVQDEDLAQVLQMLSMQSQRNIVVSRNVSASVTTNLYGVTFYEALDAILHINGFGYVEKGNFIYVYTLEELKEIEAESRQRIAKVMKLNYLNAIDAAEFVKPLLSEGGQIKTNGKTEAFPSGEKPGGADEFALGATMLVFDFEENVAEIEKMIKELDTKPAQVLVEATILQSALTEANAFGVDFSVLAGDFSFSDFSGAAGPLGAINGLIAGRGSQLSGGASTPVAVPGSGGGRGIGSTPGNTAGPATFKAGVVEGDVAAFLRMLDEVTDTTILSKPKVLALNRQPARVLVGRKVGYLSTTSTDTSTTQTVEFLDTGTQLYFRPFVSNDGLIRMELKPQVSTAVVRDSRDASGATVTIPDEDTSELVTNVMVRDGQTIVLGGLFREETTATRRQVPFMGDIPIIGAAFRGHDDETQRAEIIFMITPSIVNDKMLADQGERALASVERVRTGTREGLLPWSRDKMTGRLNLEAERELSAGNSKRAESLLRRSLSLNPRQPEAIQMLEQVTGTKQDSPHRSMLEDIIRIESRKGQQAHANSVTGAATAGGLKSNEAAEVEPMFDDASQSELPGNEADFFAQPAYEPVPEPAPSGAEPQASANGLSAGTGTQAVAGVNTQTTPGAQTASKNPKLGWGWFYPAFRSGPTPEKSATDTQTANVPEPTGSDNR